VADGRGKIGILPEMFREVKGGLLGSWREDSRESLAFHRGRFLDLGHVFELGQDTLHDSPALLDVSDLAAAEENTHQDLVLMLQELAGVSDFDFDVMAPRLGPHADFLELGVVLLLAMLLLLLFVLELSIVHNTANGRSLRGSNFDQIQPGGASGGKRFFPGDDAELVAIGIDHTQRRDSNLLVDAEIAIDRFVLLTAPRATQGPSTAGSTSREVAVQ
jgi:hypothetical protein